jgi:hypothetical protein
VIDGRQPEDVGAALLDVQHPSADPVIQGLQLMMSGFGYNFYDAGNVARANDQIVRDHAAQFLAEADRTIRRLEREYRERFIGAPSREQPFPTSEQRAPLDELERTRKRIEDAATAIRCFEAPGGDAIWFRFRAERATLVRLLGFDAGLVAAARAIATTVDSLRAESVCDRLVDDAVREPLASLETLLAQRRSLLAPPV